jgi:hypothetical protein
MFPDGFQRLDLHQFGLFVGESRVYALHIVVGQLLQLVFGPMLVVLGDLALFAQLVDVFHLIATDVTHRDAALLGHVPGHPDQLPAALLGELGDGKAYDLAVVLGVEADVRVSQGALDVLEGVRVEGGYGEEARRPVRMVANWLLTASTAPRMRRSAAVRSMTSDIFSLLPL